ncbi:hypothetical protein, partial [Escherichia coli]|uniref:hypothetical protein n=1 Tax=Escherichia coli TaxID=562 RepID=UPI001FA977F3
PPRALYFPIFFICSGRGGGGGGAGRDVSLPAPIKPLGSQSVFSDSMRLSRMELKEKITKEFDIDNW